MEINIENRKSYIYVKVTGQMSLSAAEWEKIKYASTNIVNTIKENNIYKVLFDCRGILAKLSTVDRFLLAAFFAKENYKLVSAETPPLKITLVVNPSIIDSERFGEKVANNRGLYGLITENIEEALKWLDIKNPIKQEP